MRYWIILALTCANLGSATAATPAKVGLVNFKRVVEESKIGKQEQGNFESIKKQMEDVLKEKESALNEIAGRLNDPDQLDIMSPEAETELKRKFRAQSQEITQLQQQYLQTLQQTNMKVLQRISDEVSEASKTVATSQQLDIILNDDGCFFYSPSLDVTTQVVAALDAQFETKQKNAPTAPAQKP